MKKYRIKWYGMNGTLDKTEVVNITYHENEDRVREFLSLAGYTHYNDIVNHYEIPKHHRNYKRFEHLLFAEIEVTGGYKEFKKDIFKEK